MLFPSPGRSALRPASHCLPDACDFLRPTRFHLFCWPVSLALQLPLAHLRPAVLLTFAALIGTAWCASSFSRPFSSLHRLPTSWCSSYLCISALSPVPLVLDVSWLVRPLRERWPSACCFPILVCVASTRHCACLRFRVPLGLRATSPLLFGLSPPWPASSSRFRLAPPLSFPVALSAFWFGASGITLSSGWLFHLLPLLGWQSTLCWLWFPGVFGGCSLFLAVGLDSRSSFALLRACSFLFASLLV